MKLNSNPTGAFIDDLYFKSTLLKKTIFMSDIKSLTISDRDLLLSECRATKKDPTTRKGKALLLQCFENHIVDINNREKRGQDGSI